MSSLRLLILTVLVLLLYCAPLQAADRYGQDGITIVEENEGARKRIRIRAEDGTIDWRDVVRGIARAERLDEDVLRPLLPSGNIHIGRRAARWTVLGLSLATPGVHMRVIQPQGADELALEVVIDKDEFENTRRDVTRLIRKNVNRNGSRDQALSYGLAAVAGSKNVDSDRPLVVLIHGFNSRPAYMTGLAEAIQTRKLACASFGYPNDAPIAESASRLAEVLKQHASDYPEQKIILVTNSMGGLLARAVIENSSLDPGNVQQLIMIAPPNHGSLLARIAHGLDVWEYVLQPQQDDVISECVASIADGLAEANRDLRPSSAFLRELNSRARHPDVRYSIILGTAGPLTDEQVDELRLMLKDASGRSRIVRFFAPLVDDSLRDMDELIRGKGDGVVAVKRGMLEGVDDLVLLDVPHSAASVTSAAWMDHALLEALLDRLPEE